MNLFILDKDPIKAAQLQCDKHVVKMIVESAQMLSTAHRMLDGVQSRRKSQSGKTMSKYWELPDDREAVLYKAVHMGHPCTVWTMQNDNNYRWHFEHFSALCKEYTYRYDKIHATQTKLRKYLAMKHEPQCINENDIVQSYKDYYQTKQDRFKMAWTRRPIPEWFEARANA